MKLRALRCIRLFRITKLFFLILFFGLAVLLSLNFYKTVKLRKDTFVVGSNWSSHFTQKLQQPDFKYKINCNLVYELDPVSIGKTLEIKKQNIVDLKDEEVKSLTADCDAYRARNHGKYSAVEENDFPIAYSVVVHKDAAMVERLLSIVYMPQNIYCIHYDKKSSPAFQTAMQNLATCFPNVFIASKLEFVEYGHISRLRADLNCLSDLLKSSVPWKYVINLCGQDFPLKPNFELISELKRLDGANMLETGRPSDLKKQRFIFHHELQDVHYEYRKIPVKTTASKATPPSGIEVFVGSAYFVLSHSFVQYTFDSQVTNELLAWLEDTYSPDETFWATMVRLPGIPGGVPRDAPDITDLQSKTRLVKWDYLEGTYYPPCTGTHQRSVCIYGAAELRWLLNSEHWFANKFDFRVDPVIIKCLEEKINEKQRKLVMMSSKL
ncbi:beta-1,3-galactosyl-O-glycosyl-glycoprotein beta-1,6-N-acetylglucosaminyltransferase 4 [Protopterus annectens]|uniref:beta-1,3-galactosyl-O-glycosyl-glycoprotein beta-1,6-N-acetylglucosaminyltransferase 4 n=1 Tax=Protopterus annectens TaxID=7888 RepID=UPI001CF9A267|nr:beta-1,3-galactosyl-O-glycosyl-glycoprotein beta-1,6-N-acetylglucosaminyltransferase 4 [Protopterus annectens]